MKKFFKKNLLIIGAGDAARDIIKALNTSSIKGIYNVVGLIDDNPNKIGYTISGVRILGDRHQIVEICKIKSVDTIFFSIANISAKDKKEIIRIPLEKVEEYKNSKADKGVIAQGMTDEEIEASRKETVVE